MFYRLISNLQYSPGLIGQVSFYSKRLKQEEFVRRVGLIFTVLALTLQAFLIMSPPQPSLASSTNDIVYGGGDKNKIIRVYKANRDDLGRTDIQAIYNRFGVGEAELAAASVITIQSRAEKNYHSIGRHARFGSDIEHKIDVPGADPVYIRPLHAWDSGAYSTYKALYGINNSGKQFWILLNCGNIVLNTPYPDPLSPGNQVEKSIKQPTTSTVLRGQDILYSIRYRNNGPGNAGLMAVEDLIPKHTTYVGSNGPVKWVRNGKIHWDHVDKAKNPYGILGPTDWFHAVNLRVKVNNDAPNGYNICNVATITAANDSPDSSGPHDACIKVYVPPEPQAEAACTLLSFEKLSRTNIKFTARASTEDGATIDDFIFNFGDETTATVANSDDGTAMTEHEYGQAGQYQTEVIVNTSVGQKKSEECKATVDIKEPSKEPEVVHRKEASNITQSIEDADGTTAQAGDQIEYRLITENIGEAAAADFQFPAEDVADILEYANIEDLGDATFNEDKKKLTWEPQTIEPGEVVVKKFIVKIKDPIPQTPVSASDPGSFDLTLSNKYGSDTVEIKLPPSNNKRIEGVASQLPNTGIGDNIVTSTFLIGMSTYFYSRNKLISKELRLIKREFTHG